MPLTWKEDFCQTLASDSILSCKTVNPVPLNKEQDAFNCHQVFNFVLKILSNTTHQQKVTGIEKKNPNPHPPIQFPSLQPHPACTLTTSDGSSPLLHSPLNQRHPLLCHRDRKRTNLPFHGQGQKTYQGFSILIYKAYFSVRS